MKFNFLHSNLSYLALVPVVWNQYKIREFEFELQDYVKCLASLSLFSVVLVIFEILHMFLSHDGVLQFEENWKMMFHLQD